MSKSSKLRCEEPGCVTMCNPNRFGKCPAHKPRVSCLFPKCVNARKRGVGESYCAKHKEVMSRRARDDV